MSFLYRHYNLFVRVAGSLQPLVLLAVRILVAQIFWQSGMVKISDFDNTVDLFASEYQVPLLPPYLAALSATFFELSCPLLLLFGLGTRLATLPLLGITAVIQLTYDQNIDHLFWAALLGVLLTFGAGAYAADHLLDRKFLGKQSAEK